MRSKMLLYSHQSDTCERWSTILGMYFYEHDHQWAARKARKGMERRKGFSGRAPSGGRNDFSRRCGWVRITVFSIEPVLKMAQALFLTCRIHCDFFLSISEAPLKIVGKHRTQTFDFLSDLTQDSVLYWRYFGSFIRQYQGKINWYIEKTERI